MFKGRDIKNELKELWDDNKKAIKVGAACLVIGSIYGFCKGLGVCNANISRLIDRIPYSPDPGDISEWVYSNLDNPEVINEIRWTLSEIDKL